MFPSTARRSFCSAPRASFSLGAAVRPQSGSLHLGAGAILGPLGLESFIESFPLLYWFTVVDPKSVSGIANLRVVFLLFLIGMELSYDRLKAMRRLISGLGSLQIVLSTVAIGVVAALLATKLRWPSSSVPALPCPRRPLSSRSFPGNGDSAQAQAGQVSRRCSRKSWRSPLSCFLLARANPVRSLRRSSRTHQRSR